MNAPACDLLTRTGQPRCLIVGLIERVGEVVAQGHIEDTGAGISLTLTNAQGVRVLNLHNGTPADATWALAKLLERLT